jgi:hypothetical protein
LVSAGNYGGFGIPFFWFGLVLAFLVGDGDATPARELCFVFFFKR